jgi:hypothetical protein
MRSPFHILAIVAWLKQVKVIDEVNPLGMIALQAHYYHWVRLFPPGFMRLDSSSLLNLLDEVVTEDCYCNKRHGCAEQSCLNQHLGTDIDNLDDGVADFEYVLLIMVDRLQKRDGWI